MRAKCQLLVTLQFSWKIYEVVDDEEARVLHQIRVIDESGEDYLYPEDFFVRVDLPQSLEKQLLESA